MKFNFISNILKFLNSLPNSPINFAYDPPILTLIFPKGRSNPWFIYLLRKPNGRMQQEHSDANSPKSVDQIAKNPLGGPCKNLANSKNNPIGQIFNVFIMIPFLER